MIQIAGLILILIGLYGLITKRNIIKMIIALNILEIGLNLFIVSVGYVKDGIAPILTKIADSSGLNFVDPLPQALVLTAIVIGMGTTALSLAFARKIYGTYQTFDLNEMEVEE